MPTDTGSAPFSPPQASGTTASDPSNNATNWVLFRPDGIPVGLDPTASTCGTIGDTGTGGAGLYVTSGGRDYAVTLAPLGGAARARVGRGGVDGMMDTTGEWTGATIGQARQRTGGFTLVEVMIVIGILTFGLLSLAAMQIKAMHGSDRGRHATNAAAIAESKMEQLQQDAWASIAVTGGFIARSGRAEHHSARWWLQPSSKEPTASPTR